MPYIKTADHRFKIDEIAEIVKEHDRKAWTMLKTAKVLNNKGYRTMSGAKWTHGTVSNFRREHCGLEARGKGGYHRAARSASGTLKPSRKPNRTQPSKSLDASTVLSLVDLYQQCGLQEREVFKSLIDSL